MYILSKKSAKPSRRSTVGRTAFKNKLRRIATPLINATFSKNNAEQETFGSPGGDCD